RAGHIKVDLRKALDVRRLGKRIAEGTGRSQAVVVCSHRGWLAGAGAPVAADESFKPTPRSRPNRVPGGHGRTSLRCGSAEFTIRTLRFAWHITTVAWFGFAALMVHAGRGDLTVPGMLRIIGASFIAAGFLPL